mgnify:CR=1 FL=1
MLFSEIIGQADIKERLRRSVDENRIPHAQLFTGPEGSGKLPLAIAYGQYINCPNKQNGDACGSCPSCTKYNHYVHPDLHFVFPVKRASEKKPENSDDYLRYWREVLQENPYLNPRRWYRKLELENKQGTIPANESENIIKKLSFKPYEAEYKVMIIWLPERMHQATANKLLKLLEEPPPKTLFLMVSENADNLLPTIRSRTQKILVPAIDEQSMLEALQQKHGLEEDQARETARLSQGNYLSALHFIQTDEQAQTNLERFISLMRLAYSKNIPGLIGWVEELAPIGRENLKSFLDYAARMVRENFMLNLNMNNIVYLSQAEKDFSKNFSKFIHPNNARPIYEELNRTYRDISMNAHAKTTLLDMSIQMIKLLKL